MACLLQEKQDGTLTEVVSSKGAVGAFHGMNAGGAAAVATSGRLNVFDWLANCTNRMGIVKDNTTRLADY
jgi:hypothetical protein